MDPNAFNGQSLAFVSLMVSIASGIYAMIMSSRRNPPIDAQFATKSELAQMKGEISGQASAIRTELTLDIRRIFERMDVFSQDINAAAERRNEALRKDITELAVKIERVDSRTIHH